MGECDHILGMHYHYDCLINLSVKDKYNLDYVDEWMAFDYCPSCGEKLEHVTRSSEGINYII